MFYIVLVSFFFFLWLNHYADNKASKASRANGKRVVWVTWTVISSFSAGANLAAALLLFITIFYGISFVSF